MPSTPSPGERTSDEPAGNQIWIRNEVVLGTVYEWTHVVGCFTGMITPDWRCKAL
jgi:hypothetical protein